MYCLVTELNCCKYYNGLGGCNYEGEDPSHCENASLFATQIENNNKNARAEFEKFYADHAGSDIYVERFSTGEYAEKNTREAWAVWMGCWSTLNK